MDRRERVARLGRQVTRELATSTMLIHHGAAEMLGLNATDLTCLDLLHKAVMPLTPVNLAELTGLTPGAITGVADRLEAAGFVNRVRSTSDRRRWELQLAPDRQGDEDALYAPLTTAITDLCRQYDDDQLKVVADFLTKLGPVLDVEAHRLRRRASRHGQPTRAGA